MTERAQGYADGRGWTTAFDEVALGLASGPQPVRGREGEESMETTGHGIHESGDMEGLYDVGFMALLRELVRSGERESLAG